MITPSIKNLQKTREFPGSPAVRTYASTARGLGLVPVQATKIPQAMVWTEKKKKNYGKNQESENQVQYPNNHIQTSMLFNPRKPPWALSLLALISLKSSNKFSHSLYLVTLRSVTRTSELQYSSFKAYLM